MPRCKHRGAVRVHSHSLLRRSPVSFPAEGSQQDEEISPSTRLLFQDISAGSKPGCLGGRQIVGCSQPFSITLLGPIVRRWHPRERDPETGLVGSVLRRKNGLRRKAQARMRPMWRWTTRRCPKVATRRHEADVLLHRCRLSESGSKKPKLQRKSGSGKEVSSSTLYMKANDGKVGV